MNDEIQINADDMVDGVKGVSSMAKSYQEGVGILGSTLDLIENAFERYGESPVEARKAWELYRDLIWSALAESQDNLNNATTYLADYTSDMFELDNDNAAEIDSVTEFSESEKPKEK